MRIGRIFAGIGALVAGASAVFFFALIIASVVYAGSYVAPKPLAPALAKACLAGNDSACQAYPVAKDQDAKQAAGQDGGQIFVGFLGTGVSGFIAAWLGGEAIGRSLF